MDLYDDIIKLRCNAYTQIYFDIHLCIFFQQMYPILLFMFFGRPDENIAFGNIPEKDEHAGFLHFLVLVFFFPQYFLVFHTQFPFFLNGI